MTPPMAMIRLKGLQRQVDERGNVRFYVRKHRGRRIRIEGEPGSPAFMAAYHAAMADSAPPPSKRPKLAPQGSIVWLIDQYKASALWAGLAPSTQRARGLILDGVIKASQDEEGFFPISALTSQAVREGRDRRAATPAAANTFVKTLRAMMNWAIEAGLIEHNPASAVKPLPGRRGGFKTATAEEVAAYRNKWAVGTQARLALELGLFTGLRRSDLVRLSPVHLKDGAFTIRPQKTPEITVTIALAPALAEVIEATPRLGRTYIARQDGNPYAPESLTNQFHDWARACGMAASLHGLRKRAASEMAEAGLTENQLMAAFGWTNPATAAIYTKAANRVRMGAEAWSRLDQSRNKTSPNTAPREGKPAKSARKTNAQ